MRQEIVPLPPASRASTGGHDYAGNAAPVEGHRTHLVDAVRDAGSDPLLATFRGSLQATVLPS